MNGLMQQQQSAAAQQVVNTLESAIDQEIAKMDNLTDKDLANIRQQRLKEIKGMLGSSQNIHHHSL